MKRLYHQFYLTMVASLVAVVLSAGALWRFAPSETPSDQAFEMAGALVAAQLAPVDADKPKQQQAIERLHERLHVDLGLFDSDRRPAGSGWPTCSYSARCGARRAVGSTVGAAARPGRSVFQTAAGSSRVLRRGSAVRCWV